MQSLFKKSFNIVKDSPFITLFFVLYLIALFLVIQAMVTAKNFALAGIIGILLSLLTCAFISGWFGMIRTSVLVYKEDKTPEEKLNEAIKLKNDFFSGVSTFILPMFAGFLVFTALLYGHSCLSDILFGKIDDVLYNLSKYANDPEAFKNYFISLPNSTWNLIFKKSVFPYVTLCLITLTFLYWAASLYLNCNCSINPVRALIDSFKTMFLNFFETISIFILLTIVNFVLMLMQAVFIDNVIISFIAMILRIYFAAFIIVLIFDLYDSKQKKCTTDCNNRTNCFGQNSVDN